MGKSNNHKFKSCNLVKYFQLRKQFYLWQRDYKKKEDMRSGTCTARSMVQLLVQKLQPKSFQIFHHRNQQRRKCTNTTIHGESESQTRCEDINFLLVSFFALHVNPWLLLLSFHQYCHCALTSSLNFLFLHFFFLFTVKKVSSFRYRRKYSFNIHG